MRNLLQHKNFWKGTIVSILMLAAVVSPFSVSNSTFKTNVAEAAASCPSGYGLPLDMGNGTSQCFASSDNGLPAILVDNQTGQVAGATLSTGAQQDASGKITNQTTTTNCAAGLLYVINFPTCLFRSFVSLTAATLIYFASWLLTVAGVLFNWLIDNTIVHFTNVYSAGVQSAVENGWTAFRDLANILIIGMFTFIAISMILGLKEFGQKRLIANVLIVAVLINFSLLGTKMIIDASNFVAGQIYSAAALDGNGNQYSAVGTIAQNGANITNANANTNDPNNTASSASAGIAGQFINLLGVASFGNAYGAVNNIAQATDNGWIALLHGVFVFTILVCAALVLFYGSFLLVSRMILLIFLMFSAALAFASYIVPAWSGSSYGWKVWLTTLIKTTVLAPILMLLLWITLNVSYAIHCPTAVNGVCSGAGSFGDLLAHPNNAPDISTLVNYCIILGLLFVSFKLSNLFASKIAGFNYASMVPGLGIGIGGALSGFLGRNTLGWGGAVAGGALRRYTNRPNVVNEHGETIQNFDGRRTGLLGRLNRAATRASLGVGDSTFNPLKTNAGVSLGSNVAVPKAFLGKNAFGGASFEAAMKEKAKHADEIARKIGPTDEQKGQIRDNAQVEMRRNYREQRTQTAELIRTQQETRQAIENTRDEATNNARQAQQPERQDVEQRVQAHDDAIRRAENEKTTLRTRQESEMRAAHTDIERATLTARHQTELNQIDERVAGHQGDRTAAVDTRTNLETTARETAAAELAPRLAELDRTIAEHTARLADLNRSENAAVQGAGERAVTNSDVALRRAVLMDPRAADKISGTMRNHERDENLRRLAALTPHQPPPPTGGAGGGGH